ncbi:hypothetical protein QFC20_004681 [Naganishia adeliensis]|uniref:Uncharacterized protein n=1 Tax=Naganishia adeliensis TaxID=92952 RepID=A0ACC2VWX2_9TREE|nr:hypothetical protein QFC20_004681 [Naganishia adeliensis]
MFTTSAAEQIASDTSMLPAINNDDLHDINAMTSFESDNEEDAVVVSDFENDNDNNAIEPVEPEDVIRYFWRGSDIKYLFIFEGREILLSAEQVELKFIGVKSALGTYWKKTSRHRVSTNKVVNHLKRKGAAGFYREMLWHLLLDAMHFKLMAVRKKNKLRT